MSDIRIVWDVAEFQGDWLLAGSVLDESRALATAVAVSLLTDRTADDDDALPFGTSDRRGWWGDFEAGLIHGGTPVGSKLWLLRREKQEPETRARAEQYIREALAWMLADGVVASIDLVVDWFADGALGAEITMHRGGKSSVAVRFESLWTEMQAV